jgi:sugar phosphate isomerase/epimerase
MSKLRSIGCSTYCCIDHPLACALEYLSSRTSLVEILSDSQHSLYDQKEVCLSYDFHYTVHSPCADLNIACCNETIRGAGMEVIREMAGICDEIGAGVLVIHPGYVEAPFCGGRSRASLERSLDEIAAIGEEYRVAPAIENLGHWDVCHFRYPGFIELLEEKGIPFVLDVGHAHLNGCLEEFLKRGSPVHVHLHDNNGHEDEHLACGAGSIDFSCVIPQVPKDATIIVEVTRKEDFDRSYAFLQSINKSNLC